MINKKVFETNSETTYSIGRLSFEDVEMICQGLDEIAQEMEIDKLERKNALVEAFENMLPAIMDE